MLTSVFEHQSNITEWISDLSVLTYVLADMHQWERVFNELIMQKIDD